MDELRIIPPEKETGMTGILAAVSGGADSVALLALLREAAKTYPLRLTAAHFEHGIRAEASLADAAFVRALCDEWRIPLIEESADVPALAKARSIGMEEAAREARYEFLRRARVQARANYIALAHHRDDQAETALMHLLRGCGLRGMVGMKEFDGVLYRPLLKYPKEVLTSYLRERGIAWREDATNQEADNPRNALRLNVLPAVDRIYPGAREAICRFSEIAAAENDFMDGAADEFLGQRAQKLPFGWMLELESGDSSQPVHRALLMRGIHRLTGLSHEAVTRIAGLWNNPDAVRSICLEGGWLAERGWRGLYLVQGAWNGLPGISLPAQGEVALPDGLGRLTIAPGRGVPVAGNPFCQELDADALEGAVIRTRRNGDVIRPLGAPGRQKLSDYFINRRIDRPLRDMIPLIARENEILWVAGEGISERAKLTKTSRAVRIELTGWPLQKFGGS